MTAEKRRAQNEAEAAGRKNGCPGGLFFPYVCILFSFAPVVCYLPFACFLLPARALCLPVFSVCLLSLPSCSLLPVCLLFPRSPVLSVCLFFPPPALPTK